jgi:hypothetical protein
VRAGELRRGRSRLPLLLVTAIAAVTLAALTAARPRLGAAAWTRGDDVALLAAWTVAVAASAWLLLTTGACALALGLGRPNLARGLSFALPVGIRRLVEVAIVASCVALPALPASATPNPPRTTPVFAEEPVVRATVPAAPSPTTTPAPAPAPPSPAPPPAAERVVVRAGDNLWLIARASLARISAGRPTDAEVARHWRAVIAANRSTLRSGDPSVIFPGEIVTVPPASAVS